MESKTPELPELRLPEITPENSPFWFQTSEKHLFVDEDGQLRAGEYSEQYKAFLEALFADHPHFKKP